MKVGIIFATRQEAEPFLSLASAAAIETDPSPIYRVSAALHPACITAVSGMGKVAAATLSAHLILQHGVQVLVNAGLCGCLTREKRWKVGELLRISSAVEGDCDRFGQPESAHDCTPGWFANLEPARLVTCDRPVFNDAPRQRLAAMGDLVDMEGAAVARVAHYFGYDCAMLKGISDCADETGRQDIAAQIGPVAARIAAALAEELRHQTNRKRS